MGAGTTDFNGDRFADMSILYDYGGGEAGLFVLPGKPVIDDGVARSPYTVWSTPRGNFWPSVMKITAGDFNGDGLSDVLALYDYGRGEAGLFVFPGTTGRFQGASTPYLVWNAPPGNFDVSRATPAAGDFTGDGLADLLVMYNYGNNEYALWVMPGTTSRSPGSVNPYWCWHSQGWTSFPQYQLNTGDINGDGRTDLVVAVDNATWFIAGTSGSGDDATWPCERLGAGMAMG